MEEVKENVVEPKYILHDPKSPDIFIMLSILKSIGINKFASCLKNEGVQSLVKDITKKKKVNSEDITTIAGVGVLTEVVQVILEGLPLCEDKVYKLLSNTSNLTIEEIKELDAVTFLDMVVEFFTTKMDFIKAAWKLFDKGN